MHEINQLCVQYDTKLNICNSFKITNLLFWLNLNKHNVLKVKVSNERINFVLKNKENNIHRSSAKNSLKSLKMQNSPGAHNSHFHSFNQRKWLPYKILGGKPVKNVKIDPQTTEIWSKKLNKTSWVREGVISV